VSAFMSAAEGAALMGIGAVAAKISQASAATAQGEGESGDARAESDARAEAIAGKGGPHDAIELGKDGNPDLVEGPRTPEQNAQDAQARDWLNSEAPKGGGRTVLEATAGKGIEYGVTQPTDGPLGPTKSGTPENVPLTNYGPGENEFAAHTHPPTGDAEFSNADLAAARTLRAPLYLGDPKGNLWALDPIANTIMFVSRPPIYVPGTTALPDTSLFR
jgi:hypothetical protein